MKTSILDHRSAINEIFLSARRHSIDICKPLAMEDYNLQGMPDTSPPKWHLAHTTWFFETFILQKYLKDYRPWHVGFDHLFNSYYKTVGRHFNRPQRGLLSRPSLDTIFEYRQHVDRLMVELLQGDHSQKEEIVALTVLGIHHEQQHQELILMDVKYSFSCNPLLPEYQKQNWERSVNPNPLEWLDIPEGLFDVGHKGEGFCFDNETPSHKTYLPRGLIANRLVTNGEYAAFIADGGYETVSLWLSEGWDYIKAGSMKHPIYWMGANDSWFEFTLQGRQELNPFRPVSHLSYFEADAYARWAGCRLPTEFEWEIAAGDYGTAPVSENTSQGPLYLTSQQNDWLHCLWQWTSSSYAPYPGYKPAPGAIGEYNGKFMCNQYVLRGGSFATPMGHLRLSYRNFFPASSCWMFSGLRLAKDL